MLAKHQQITYIPAIYRQIDVIRSIPDNIYACNIQTDRYQQSNTRQHICLQYIDRQMLVEQYQTTYMPAIYRQIDVQQSNTRQPAIYRQIDVSRAIPDNLQYIDRQMLVEQYQTTYMPVIYRQIDVSRAISDNIYACNIQTDRCYQSNTRQHICLQYIDRQM